MRASWAGLRGWLVSFEPSVESVCVRVLFRAPAHGTTYSVALTHRERITPLDDEAEEFLAAAWAASRLLWLAEGGVK